jgi:hypothetical protein
VGSFLGAMLRDMAVDCCSAQSNKNMIERRRWRVACLRILLGTAASVSDDPRPEARTARGSCTEIHGVFTDVSNALTLKLRTRRTERSSCRVYECCVSTCVVLQAELTGKVVQSPPRNGVSWNVLWEIHGERRDPWRKSPVERIPMWQSCSLDARWRRK